MKYIKLTLFFILGAYSCFSIAENLKAYFADFVVAATLENIDPVNASVNIPAEYSSCASSPPNIAFSVGFTSGLDYKGDVLHGLEWSATTIYLYSFSDSPCAIGTRVNASNAVGYSNLESLAYCASDDSFYTVDFDFTAHMGQLIKIDPITGIGSAIGSHMAANVRVTGMTCDVTGQLWAVTSGFGGGTGRNPELLTINTSSGVETLIGELSVPANQVESLAVDRDQADKLFAAGKALYEVNKLSGTATLVGGSYNEIWAMAGLSLSDILFENGFDD